MRVEAHRLRRKLARYYEGEGANHHLRIVLSPGGYVPEFVVHEEGVARGNGPIPQQATAEDHDLPTTADTPPLSPPDQSNRIGKYRKPVIAIATAALALTVLATSFFVARRAYTKESVTTAEPVAWVGASPGPEIRILAGRTKANYTDRFGHQWGPDRYFSGGTTLPGPKEFLGRPPDAGLFAMMRTGEFSHHIPANPGEYELRLYCAEPIFRLANESNGGGENERRFHVSINGKQVLSAFDVVADSGIAPVSIRALRGVTPGRDGMVHVQFAAAYGTAFVNGVELMASPPAIRYRYGFARTSFPLRITRETSGVRTIISSAAALPHTRNR